MKLEILEDTELKYPGKAASMFPGAVLLPDGTVLLLFAAGSGFESTDSILVQARSLDQGKTWQMEGPVFDEKQAGYTLPATFYAKPAVLSSGELLAAGYAFLRDKPEMGLSDYAEKFGHFPKVENLLIRSRDQGKNWSCEKIVHEYEGMEISGPVLPCRDGKIRFFASPFLLNAPVQQGFAFESGDQGKNWKKSGTFFSSADTAAWEVRSAELDSGRILLVIWAYDLKRQEHRNNQLLWSDDGGKNWTGPVDTGLRGQASNLLVLKDRIGIIQTHREGNAPGIFLTMLEQCDEKGIVPGEEFLLWDAAGKNNSGGRIEKQFASLKFGQPSLLPLGNGDYLLFFWQYGENGCSIRIRKIRLNG